nr:hypothetical protein [Tanacetum cinerariifolium]
GPLGKFDEKADDGFFLGCSLVAKAFRDSVFSEELLEFTVADDHPAPNELDQPESVMYQAKESHLVAVKRIFRKSTFVACQILDGKLVCWSANKQSSVAMSSAEDEYVAAIVIVLRSFNEPSMVDDDDETSKDKEIDKLMALISLSFKKIYKPTNNNLRTSLNTSRANQDNSPRINRNTRYESQRSGNVAGARETVGSSMVQKSGIQC